jgi:hypothetical protein
MEQTSYSYGRSSLVLHKILLSFYQMSSIYMLLENLLFLCISSPIFEIRFKPYFFSHILRIYFNLIFHFRLTTSIHTFNIHLSPLFNVRLLTNLGNHYLPFRFVRQDKSELDCGILSCKNIMLFFRSQTVILFIISPFYISYSLILSIPYYKIWM